MVFIETFIFRLILLYYWRKFYFILYCSRFIFQWIGLFDIRLLLITRTWVIDQNLTDNLLFHLVLSTINQSILKRIIVLIIMTELLILGPHTSLQNIVTKSLWIYQSALLLPSIVLNIYLPTINNMLWYDIHLRFLSKRS